MSDTDRQHMPHISQADSEIEWILVPPNSNATTSRAEGFTHQVEQIEKELLSLKLQRRRIQQRFQSLRQAIAILIDIFGAAILDGDDQPFRIPQNLRSRRHEMIDLCAAVLQETGQWLTIPEILGFMQNRSPEITSSMQKPAVSISNALRSLHHRGKVRRLYSPAEAKWRWVPATSSQNNSTIISSH